MDELAQGGVGLDDAGVNAKVAPFEQAVLEQTGKDEFEGGLIDIISEAAADDAEAGVVRRGLLEPV